MNYKSIIKNQRMRFKILRAFNWVPDRMMIKFQYRMKTGRNVNLKNPLRFSEKLQWYKLYYRNPVMRQCVDKYLVRDYVKKKGLEKILNPLYGVYKTPDDINFDKLPNKFVLKTTQGGGGKNVFICTNRKKMNVEKVKVQLGQWLRDSKGKHFGREWAYNSKNNMIIAEKYIEAERNDLVDYKFFCFDGKVKFIYVISDRKLGESAKLGIYDSNFNKINAYRSDENKEQGHYEKPKYFSIMKKYASILSSDFPHARIDFYENMGKVIFGEITFYDGSGYMTFDPDSFDYEIGKEFKLTKYEIA